MQFLGGIHIIRLPAFISFYGLPFWGNCQVDFLLQLEDLEGI